MFIEILLNICEYLFEAFVWILVFVSAICATIGITLFFTIIL
jgi:hypothetical protein